MVGQFREQMGFAVAVSGRTVWAGAPDTRVGGTIYLFVEPSTGWVNMTETGEVSAVGEVAGQLGFFVRLSNGTLVAGAPRTGVGGKGSAGAAFVFGKAP